MYKIGFLPGLDMGSWEIERICAAVRGAGYEALELPVSFICPDSKTDSERNRVLRAAENEGLEISEAVVQRDLLVTDETGRKDSIAYITRCVGMLPELGIGTANLFTGPRPWVKNPVRVGLDIPQGRAWEFVFGAFDEILPEAEKHGVRLAVENVWGMLCGDFYTCRFLIEHYNSENLGVNFDPSHDILAGNTDVGWLVHQWGKKIFHVHLKDAAGIAQTGRFTFPLLGDGLVDWRAFFRAFDDIGYAGCMSVEFEAFDYYKNIFGGRLEDGAKLSRALVEKLMSLK